MLALRAAVRSCIWFCVLLRKAEKLDARPKSEKKHARCDSEPRPPEGSKDHASFPQRSSFFRNEFQDLSCDVRKMTLQRSSWISRFRWAHFVVLEGACKLVAHERFVNREEDDVLLHQTCSRSFSGRIPFFTLHDIDTEGILAEPTRPQTGRNFLSSSSFSTFSCMIVKMHNGW